MVYNIFMKAWVIAKINEPLRLLEMDIPFPDYKEILIKIHACGVCHTELDEIEGRAMPAFFPVIPGHQIVGEVVKVGSAVKKFKVGDRAGVGWIYSACGKCEYCLKGWKIFAKTLKQQVKMLTVDMQSISKFMKILLSLFQKILQMKRRLLFSVQEQLGIGL